MNFILSSLIYGRIRCVAASRQCCNQFGKCRNSRGNSILKNIVKSNQRKLCLAGFRINTRKIIRDSFK
ncbi:hypothetical protein HZS_5459 [Henneguya salminicola]|nr:hypothetical protein HZS_5459 [Henneguya salminicola]